MLVKSFRQTRLRVVGAALVAAVALSGCSRRLAELGVKVPATAGGLYRTLRAMADEGLVTSFWSPPQRGPARRVYAITDEGERYLERSIRAWASLVRSIGVMLDRYRSVR